MTIKCPFVGLSEILSPQMKIAFRRHTYGYTFTNSRELQFTRALHFHTWLHRNSVCDTARAPTVPSCASPGEHRGILLFQNTENQQRIAPEPAASTLISYPSRALARIKPADLVEQGRMSFCISCRRSQGILMRAFQWTHRTFYKPVKVCQT